MKYQKIANKVAEAKFREKISQQQIGNNIYFTAERTFPQMLKELKVRIKRTRQDFDKLKKQKVDFSVYLELGAENCQRAMFLEKKYGVLGSASDISLASLQAADGFAKPLGFKLIPQRLVCDVYCLPFAPNSLPFIFCYQTLHHFPDPKPILQEIYRVLLPGGFFFFSEEPVKQTFNINLWRRPTNLRSWEKFLKYIGILPFISRIGKTEVDHGILEEVFGLKTWEKALNVFDQVEVYTKPYPTGPESISMKINGKNWLKPKLSTRTLIFFWGGGINAICQKKGAYEKSNLDSIFNLLYCPECLKNNKISKIIIAKTTYCQCCNQKYPNVGNIPILLPGVELKKLYPNLI